MTLDFATLFAVRVIYLCVPWKKGNRLRMIPEPAADEPTRRIFHEIRQALGVPVLRIFFPALAAYPEFLRLHWNLLQPVVESSGFFACAGRLRAESYTRAHNYFRIPDLCASLEQARFSAGARQELTAAMELFHYRDPLLLLLFCAQLQAFEGPTGTPHPAQGQAEHPVYAERPVFVEEENASSVVHRRYDEIRHTLDLPYVNTEYEAMARFPDFLNVYWDFLHPLLQSPLYQECQYALRDSAWNLARELPGPLELSTEQLIQGGVKPEDIASVARILDLFVKNLSGLVLNVAIAKIALEGGNLALKPAGVPIPGSQQVA
jgi:hypothetical protein